MTDWLSIRQGNEPLIISIPHAGLLIPDDVHGLRTLGLALHDADHHIDRLYAFASMLGATIVTSAVSRTVIDLNRDPSGQSLYPGQATTELCPTTSFDGEALYGDNSAPDAPEIERRRAAYFDPYHAALLAQINRLRAAYPAVVLYDAHSIRSHVPRLFDGELPQYNIGSFDGASCADALTDAISSACASDSLVVNDRFKGGWITRHYGSPSNGIHAVQMELAIRGYADENGAWPPLWDTEHARMLQSTLADILGSCIAFAKGQQ